MSTPVLCKKHKFHRYRYTRIVLKAIQEENCSGGLKTKMKMKKTKMKMMIADGIFFAPSLIVLQMTSVLLQEFAQLGLSVLQHAVFVMNTIGSL